MSSASENKEGRPPLDGETHLLLPWHVTGQLSRAEAQEMEELAREDPEFARLVKEAELEAKATVSVNNALDPPSPDIWRRLENSIGHKESAGSRLRQRVSSFKAASRHFFANLTAAEWRLAAAAIMVLCVLQTGAIVYLLSASSNSGKFVAASGPKIHHELPAASFLVEFDEAAKIGEINAVLEKAGAVIVEGPLPDRVYRLGLLDGSLSAKEAALRELRASPVIIRALPQK